jgi:hypothetical protein
MKEALSSPETSVLTRATRRSILEDDILHSHRRENLKSYKFVFVFFFVSSYFHCAIISLLSSSPCHLLPSLSFSFKFYLSFCLFISSVYLSSFPSFLHSLSFSLSYSTFFTISSSVFLPFFVLMAGALLPSRTVQIQNALICVHDLSNVAFTVNHAML